MRAQTRAQKGARVWALVRARPQARTGAAVIRAEALACLVALVAAACGGGAPRSVSANSPQASSPASGTPGADRGASPNPSPSPLPPVTPLSPALQIQDPAGLSAAQAQSVRGIAGVVGVARVALAYVTAHTPGGLRQVSVAAVDPLEFRPLAPAVTAQADFVWQGLLAGDIYLAHEEQPVLNVALGSQLPMTGPHGTVPLRVGGLAANGTPNIASGLVSLQEAADLGLPGPTELLVSVAQGVNIDAVTKAITKTLPQATAAPLVALVEHALIAGTAAEKLLGSFNYKANPDGSISEDSRWVNANIVTRAVPILGSVTCNKLMFAQLTGVMTDLQQEGLANLINVAEYHQHPGNCWQPRFVDSDPSRGISYHAWGIAIDINRNENPEGGTSHQDPRLIEAFERWGYRWGGVFYPPDPMHFELAGIMQQ